MIKANITSESIDAVVAKSINIENKQYKKAFTTLAEEIAGDYFCQLNWYYAGGETKFPNEKRMQYVSKYYPFAKDGPLAVDEETAYDLFSSDVLSLKKQTLKQLGIRYVCIKANMSLIEAMEQLS